MAFCQRSLTKLSWSLHRLAYPWKRFKRHFWERRRCKGIFCRDGWDTRPMNGGYLGLPDVFSACVIAPQYFTLLSFIVAPRAFCYFKYFSMFYRTVVLHCGEATFTNIYKSAISVGIGNGMGKRDGIYSPCIPWQALVSFQPVQYLLAKLLGPTTVCPYIPISVNSCGRWKSIVRGLWRFQ